MINRSPQNSKSNISYYYLASLKNLHTKYNSFENSYELGFSSEDNDDSLDLAKEETLKENNTKCFSEFQRKSSVSLSLRLRRIRLSRSLLL